MQSCRAGVEGHVKVTIWRYLIAVLSGMRGVCIVCVCVCVWFPPAGGFPMPGLRPSSLGCVLLPLLVCGKSFGDGV